MKLINVDIMIDTITFCRTIVRISYCVIRQSIRIADAFTLCKRVYLRHMSVGLSVERKTESGGKVGCHFV